MAKIVFFSQDRNREKYIIENLKAAKNKAEVAIQSAQFLLTNAPKQVVKVRPILEKQIKEARSNIEKADKILNSKAM